MLPTAPTLSSQPNPSTAGQQDCQRTPGSGVNFPTAIAPKRRRAAGRCEACKKRHQKCETTSDEINWNPISPSCEFCKERGIACVRPAKVSNISPFTGSSAAPVVNRNLSQLTIEDHAPISEDMVCQECRRSKIRCEFTSRTDLTCNTCKRRGKVCLPTATKSVFVDGRHGGRKRPADQMTSCDASFPVTNQLSNDQSWFQELTTAAASEPDPPTAPAAPAPTAIMAHMIAPTAPVSAVVPVGVKAASPVQQHPVHPPSHFAPAQPPSFATSSVSTPTPFPMMPIWPAQPPAPVSAPLLAVMQSSMAARGRVSAFDKVPFMAPPSAPSPIQLPRIGQMAPPPRKKARLHEPMPNSQAAEQNCAKEADLTASKERSEDISELSAEILVQKIREQRKTLSQLVQHRFTDPARASATKDTDGLINWYREEAIQTSEAQIKKLYGVLDKMIFDWVNEEKEKVRNEGKPLNFVWDGANPPFMPWWIWDWARQLPGFPHYSTTTERIKEWSQKRFRVHNEQYWIDEKRFATTQRAEAEVKKAKVLGTWDERLEKEVMQRHQ